VPGSGEGIANRAPAPFVIAPEHYDPTIRSILLRKEQPLRLRLTLIGQWPSTVQALISAGFSKIAVMGLGIRPGERHATHTRPRIGLIEFSEVLSPLACPQNQVRLSFESPARIVEDGKVTPHINLPLLWKTMHRRADTLSRLYGAGPLAPDASCSDIENLAQSLRVVTVRRMSTRQRQAMTWPGVVGHVDLRGDGLLHDWPLLQFCSQVQIGKNTSFGFGRFKLFSAT
jgi:hypothetical protein